jgi:putative transcriptional regulator
MAKLDIFAELLEGMAAMKSPREGKITLRTHKVDLSPLPKVDPNSSGTLARNYAARERYSHANCASTKEHSKSGEQGRAKPNPQAAALVLLVRRFPDTLARTG